MMDLAVPSLPDQIKEAQEQGGRQEGCMDMDTQYSLVKQLLSVKKDGPGAFCALSILQDKIKIVKMR